MVLPPPIVKVLVETAARLKGYERRLFMARTVCDLFAGVVNRAADTLFWDERTLRKGLHELRTGLECLDGRTGAGRPRAEVHYPHLLEDLRAIVDGQSQTDPQFRSQRLYTRITAAEVHHQLVVQKGYRIDDMPCEETIRVKLNDLGFTLRRVAKIKPKKRFHRPTRFSTA